MRFRWLLTLFVFCVLPLCPIQAQTPLIEKTVESLSKDKNPLVARKEILDKSMKEALRLAVLDMLGPQKYQTYQNLIETKVLKEAPKLTASTKVGELQTQEAGSSANVTVRIQQQELRKLLLSLGMFYSSEQSSSVLSLIRFKSDLRKDSSSRTHSIAQEFESIATQTLWKNGFFLVPTQKMNWARWGMDLESKANSKIFLKGLISENDEGALTLRIYAESDGRSLGEVARKNTTNSENSTLFFTNAMTELSQQILESWQRGSLESSSHLVRVSPALTPTEQENFKKNLLSANVDFKGVQERRLSKNESVFTLESSLSLDVLKQKLQSVNIANRLYFASVQGEDLILQPNGVK